MKFLKKYFPIIYTVLGIAIFLYVRGIVNQDVLVAEQSKDINKVVEEVKPVDITLYVKGLNQDVTYTLRKESDETFDDFLEDLSDNQSFVYEKTEYTYGTVYDKINREIAPEGYVWKVFVDDNETTYNTKGLKLIDNTTYKLILEKK